MARVSVIGPRVTSTARPKGDQLDRACRDETGGSGGRPAADSSADGSRNGGDRYHRGDRTPLRAFAKINADPARVRRQVVDPVGDRLAEFLIDEVMDLHFPPAGPSDAIPDRRCGIRPTNSFFFVSSRGHRLARALKRPHATGDAPELRIPIRMLATFKRLAVGLQAIGRQLQANRPRRTTPRATTSGSGRTGPVGSSLVL